MKWLSLALLALAASQVQAADKYGGGCYASCRADKCIVTNEAELKRAEIKRDEKPKKLDDCMAYKSEGKDSELGLTFRAGGKQGSTTIKGAKPFREQLAAYKSLDCLVGDSPKCEAGSTQVSVQMGKAFDPGAAPSEIAGQPCALALPCGKVGLAGDGSLAIRLAEAATDGSLTLFATRGDTAPQRVDVKAGSAVVPTGALKPGQTYRYRLIKADGSMHAAGEFQVLSQRAQADSDKALTDALKGPKGEEGALESLMLDGRDWEAFQRTVGAAK
jgi:hypothetical protein